MENQEQQEEELEVLCSIYEGDENYKQVSPTVFQYKVGETDSYKSFLVEVNWGVDYPEAAPTINMDTFYNKHLLPEVKSTIEQHLISQTEELLGSAMTYSLFESAKENCDELLANQPDAPPALSLPEERTSENQTSSKSKEKKEQLTKAQKRRLTNQLDKGEKPRGWNWVDVIKHLSQSGQQKHKDNNS